MFTGIKNSIIQFNTIKFARQPVSLAIAICLLAGVIKSAQEIFILAIKHWQKPILFNDSLYLLESKQNVSLIAWLLQQHNEHRLILTKLLNLAEINAGLAPGQSAIFQILLILTLSLILWAIICRQYLKDETNRLLIILSGWLILLNPWQYENLTWEFQVPWFTINAIVFSGAILLFPNRSQGKHLYILKLIVAAFLPWLALATSGQGIAFAVAFSICSWLHSRSMGWIVSGSSALGLMTNFVLLPYSKPDHHPNLQFQLDFFLQVLLGGKWQGLAFLTVIAAGLLLCLRFRRSDPRSWAPLATLGLFSIIFAGMITISRSAFGIEQADASRYVTHSLIIGMAIILTLAYVLENNIKSNRINPISGFIVLLAILGSFPQRFTENSMTFTESWRNAQKLATSKRKSFFCHSQQIALKLKGIDLINECVNDFPNQNQLIKNYLTSNSLKAPAEWRNTLLRPFFLLGQKRGSRAKVLMNIDSLTVNDNYLSLSGWALMQTKKSSQLDNDLYLLAYYGRRPSLAIKIDKSRPDVQEKLYLSNGNVGFEELVPLKRDNQTLTSVRLVGQKINMQIWNNETEHS